MRRLSLQVSTHLDPAPVVGDPGLLERLAGNLIENAVRYNHLHGRIWVRTGTAGEHVRLVVGNTGFEVEPADVPGLFEPFRRGGRERTGARGSGLGLSIVGRSVTRTAARWAPSRGGGRLEVTVTLPAADVTPVLTGTAAVPRHHGDLSIGRSTPIRSGGVVAGDSSVTSLCVVFADTPVWRRVASASHGR